MVNGLPEANDASPLASHSTRAASSVSQAARTAAMPRHHWGMEIHGICKPGFDGVRDAFEANFAEGLEIGAAAAVTVDGEFVVDVWGGDADTEGTPWQRDTIVNVYSTTKTMGRHLHADAGRPGRARLRRPGGAVLARVPPATARTACWCAM